MYKRIFLAIITLCCFLVARTQDSLKQPCPLYLNASLLYDFPESYGLTAGAELPIVSFTKKRTSKTGLTTSHKKDLFLSIEIGAYRYPLNYTGVFIIPAIGIRYNKNEHFFSEMSFMIGCLRTFYDGEVYELTNNGNIKTVPLFGRFYALTGISYALNWQLQKKQWNRFFIHLKPSLFIQYPFNSFIKAHLNTEAGISYLLKPGNNKKQ